MTFKWYLVKIDGETTFLHEGKNIDDSPGLEVLQESVGGYIERIPPFFIHREGMPRLHFTVDGKTVNGILAEMFVHEESKLALYQFTERQDVIRYITENQNPLSFVVAPDDYILGDVVVVMTDVRSGCECSTLNLDEHPDWMKGMCEVCYLDWARSMQEASKTHTPSDENED